LLNTAYISGILLFIIIELLTAICMRNNDRDAILDYVSFAATLSSLILSVVAIIFTIVSSNRGEKQYQKLDRVSDDVRNSLTSFSNKTSHFDESIDRFKELADGLSSQINAVYEKLSGLELPINEIKKHMQANKESVKQPLVKQKDGNLDIKFSVETYVKVGSFSGNLALYACVLSKEHSIEFDLSDIAENPDDEAYKFGYLVSSSAIGVLSFGVSGNRHINVNSFADGLKEFLLPVIEKYINDEPNENNKKIVMASFESVKKHFGE